MILPYTSPRLSAGGRGRGGDEHHLRNRHGVGDGRGMDAGRGEQGVAVELVEVANTERDGVARSGPTLGQRTADVTGADDGDVHDAEGLGGNARQTTEEGEFFGK